MIKGSKIEGIVDADDIPVGTDIINLKGQTVSPGFIDVQVNGGGDALFNDSPTPETIKIILAAHRKFGTTDMLPTFITGSNGGMKKAANAVNSCLSDGVPGVLGIHFEGPFLNEGKAGVHDKSHIRKINNEDLCVIYSVIGGKTLLTLAPEEADM